MNLSTSLKFVPGIGQYYSFKLSQLNLKTIWDLINHYPFRYDDFSNITTASSITPGEKVTLKGQVWSIKSIYTRSRKNLVEAIFNDGTVPIKLIWFNQPWITGQIKTGDLIQVSGKVTEYKNKLSMMVPQWERITTIDNGQLTMDNSLHTGGLVPVYPETQGLTSKWFRTKINNLFSQVSDQINDPLPKNIKNDMLELKNALEKIHFPKDLSEVEKARKRLSFDELFYIQLATQRVKLDWRNKPTVKKFHIPRFARRANSKIQNFLKKLPFKLTKAQKKVLDEIMVDLKKGFPMNRLVQGEVGSGKTIVATITSYITHLNGYQTIYMAPTEILAFQHYETLSKLLAPFGVRVGIYTGSRKFTAKRARGGSDEGSRRTPAANECSEDVRRETSLTGPRAYQGPDIIIGTHALLSEKLLTSSVGLVIVDEQQRFGVEQRSFLRSKAKVPHFLTMTATPIPRTVLLTVYGDLDLSIIDEMPKGRRLVKTHVVPAKKRVDAYKFIEKHIADGSQVYIITPLIEESETLVSVKAATVEYQRLKKEIFPKLSLGLLHGRLKSKEKEKIINDFRDKKIDILISTSVVEVGMDIPNATIMVIEGAERFGLAQLHQLRGRVGRGRKQSFCLLFPSVKDSSIISRLKNLEKTFDGLKLSELDLKIRGGGEVFGTRQSGRFDLKIASFSDLTLIEQTREKAREILNDDPKLAKYPQLRIKLESFGKDIMPD